jgi:hypothetical protein
MIAQGFAPAEARAFFKVVNGVPALLEFLGSAPRGTETVGARL